MAWSSTRSVIGLVIALSIPAALPDGRPFPDRDLILVIAALTIVGSVLVQGLTLRRVVARASLCDNDGQEEEIESARRAMEEAASSPERRHANGFDAARQALLKLRERDRIGDEVLTRMLRETDLMSRTAEGDALPGAGPPNP
jgi:CPA1 family monovalent cation:H+ antiporter